METNRGNLVQVGASNQENPRVIINHLLKLNPKEVLVEVVDRDEYGLCPWNQSLRP